MRRLIWDYLRGGQETGGHYEGLVYSASTGMGSLANSLFNVHNLKHGTYSGVNAVLKRGKHPGAGAVSHH